MDERIAHPEALSRTSEGRNGEVLHGINPVQVPVGAFCLRCHTTQACKKRANKLTLYCQKLCTGWIPAAWLTFAAAARDVR